MNQTTLHLVFKAMLYVARSEGHTVDDKYNVLDDKILTAHDYDVTDMVDNLENVYNLIDQSQLGDDQTIHNLLDTIQTQQKIIQQQETNEAYLLERLRIATESRKELDK